MNSNNVIQLGVFVANNFTKLCYSYNRPSRSNHLNQVIKFNQPKSNKLAEQAKKEVSNGNK